MSTLELIDKKEQLRKKAEEMIANAEKEERKLNDGEADELASLKKEISEIDKQIRDINEELNKSNKKEKKMEKNTKKYTKIEMTNYTKYPDNVFINCAFVFVKIC